MAKKPTKKPPANQAVKAPDPPKKIGRPSKYDPEFCDKLVAHCSEGYSIESFAGTIGVCKDTLYEWGVVHEDFSVAIKRAHAASQAWWERMGRAGLIGQIKLDGQLVDLKGRFNAAIWIFNMKNRFKWRDAYRIHSPNPQGDDDEFDELPDSELLELARKSKT